MRDIRFTPVAFEQYTEWQKTDKTVCDKINRLLNSIPFSYGTTQKHSSCCAPDGAICL